MPLGRTLRLLPVLVGSLLPVLAASLAEVFNEAAARGFFLSSTASSFFILLI
jgi:hypothetical protein